MDVLSEVLKVVKMESAFFFNAEFSAPWSFRSPESCKLAHFINKTDGHVIVFHLIIDGSGRAMVGDDGVDLGPGDIVIFPHGSEHVMGNGKTSTVLDGERELQRIFGSRLTPTAMGGGGELTRFVCGYMVCEPRMSELFLTGLPRVFKVNIRKDEAGRWLEDSIRFAIAAANAAGDGNSAVATKLSETLFVETLRRYIVELPERQTGWLAGARDPIIGKALALIHSKPEAPWTVANLATEVGLSRSVLAERFREYLGETPMAYLCSWRLQLGAQMLRSTNYSVAQVASEVGYESEQAFNRAFKRKFAEPPARFRTMARAAGTKA